MTPNQFSAECPVEDGYYWLRQELFDTSIETIIAKKSGDIWESDACIDEATTLEVISYGYLFGPRITFPDNSPADVEAANAIEEARAFSRFRVALLEWGQNGLGLADINRRCGFYDLLAAHGLLPAASWKYARDWHEIERISPTGGKP